MPCVALASGACTQVAKAFAFLWQVFLFVGVAQVERFCMSVRSLTTDMGTERGIILMPYALLEQLMDHIGAKVKLSRSSHLLFLGPST